MGHMWWFYIKMELAAERAQLLRAQANQDQHHRDARDQRSANRGAHNRRAEFDQRAEFDELVAPIARRFARLDRRERHGRLLAGFMITTSSLCGLVLATALNSPFTGLLFFGLALFGINVVIEELRSTR